MIFPSHIFLLVLLPLALLAWYVPRRATTRLFFLNAASYIFYGWWDYRFAGLLLLTTAIDYFAGKKISQSPRARARRAWLVVSLTANLGILGVFKYYDFFAASLNSLLVSLGIGAPATLLHIVLPLGISFYTFQSMSYTIDIYRDNVSPAASFLTFSAYVSMFPQLVAGPIVRYVDINDQLRQVARKVVDFGKIADGIFLFAIGVIKKIWLADKMAGLSAAVFDCGHGMDFWDTWVGALAYTLQLYFDFSGYSDMALGLGKVLGFEFRTNFNSPYKSQDISEFWQRWHISMSTWFRDYLFIPLGGSRGSSGQTMRNLFLTMFLVGLWHGAAWHFVAWGVYHGSLLALVAAWQKHSRFRLPAIVGAALTFLCVVIGWVLFRASDLGTAKEMIVTLLGGNGMGSLPYVSSRFGVHLPGVLAHQGGLPKLLLLGVGLGLVFLMKNSNDMRRPRSVAIAALLALTLFVTLVSLSEEIPFLYFQF